MTNKTQQKFPMTMFSVVSIAAKASFTEMGGDGMPDVPPKPSSGGGGIEQYEGGLSASWRATMSQGLQTQCPRLPPAVT